MNDDTERPMRLLVVSYLYLPDTCGGAPIFTDLCQGLADRGIDVTVRCTYPFYPEWKDKSGQNGLRIDECRERRVTVERYGLFIPRDPRSLWQRLLYEASHFLSISRSLFRGDRPDAVIVFCPMMGSVAFGALHKLIHHTPMLLDIEDLPADAAAAGGITKGRFMKGVFQRVQRVLFNRYDFWRSISPVMIEQLEGYRDRAQPLMHIPHWLHPSLAQEMSLIPTKVGRVPGCPVRLLYSGNLGTKQGLLDFCKVMHQSSIPFTFRINGDGGGAAQIRDWARETKDGRFCVGPLIDEAGFARALHDTDLFVVTEKPDQRASFFPSKTIPGMATGTPILAVCSPDSPLGREVRDHGLGPWFSWDNIHEVGGTISHLVPENFIAWQQNGIKRSLFYDRERCLDLFQETLETMVRGGVTASDPRGTAFRNREAGAVG